MTVSATPSSKFQLVEVRLGRDLTTYLVQAQAEGLSLRRIASDLTTLTGVVVSHEGVRSWMTTLATQEAAAS